MSTVLPNSRENALIYSCLNTIAHLVPISAAAFYLVNNELRPENYILYGISDETHQNYLAHFQHLDPLKPANYQQGDINMVGMDQKTLTKHNKYYHEFMQPNNIQDIAEIFIRQHNQIIAGVSLLRDTLFTPKDFNRLSAILPLIELAVRDLLPETPTILTAKEQEIINLIREGSSNKRIAQILNISLSTVKTHLRNIFAKTKVTNRTELVSSGFITRYL
ncbi:helix-turn-helix transcriptional regulator [Photorhabdus laumondii subsp. laumondii]|uniref:Helix-turn-helix transcriptional regulator n=1 Tax=Photorhabdus laumondii subsp. laumondii TaxID=141679 RepID=A0A6L9JRB8_PHOLM|nr:MULTISPECIES: helix-turn-helix transcriptional regulator [Photorhabdus]MCC8383719.1 helix-turn-helix transcriptional regulator [Photorhabdus laumondii]MCC8411855.1 helix-turn-helix transcriptional regulator [Photorhabdus laumondii]NDK95751.1 helix-turn-helix transcriptional regulator [Photorhabdus laumondii subsp. laumondii]NDL22019.1 helix-turn-helix transcriptional regulator [Photorhabdus laumondii subsp. laumondii]NDL30976.1 helix-turn-helix transcriptional regulator [Photorhabdus laumon